MTTENIKNFQILSIKKEIKSYFVRNSSLFNSRIFNYKRDLILNSFKKSRINILEDPTSSIEDIKLDNDDNNQQVDTLIIEETSNPEVITDSIEKPIRKENVQATSNIPEVVNVKGKIENNDKNDIIPLAEIDNSSENKISKKDFSKLKVKVEFCTRCDLSKSRIKSVFGSGNGTTKLVCVGEAPGEAEDKQGLPFVGRSGDLLTKMLSAIDIKREDIFITNVIKCRPPLNRDPNDDEILKCSVFLDEQLQILKPKYILALGRVAAKRLLGLDYSMKKFREEIQSYKGIPVIVTYHPSALLRNPNWKRPSWQDLQKLQKLLKR